MISKEPEGFVHLAMHLLSERSSIRARLINRGQRKESDIGAVEKLRKMEDGFGFRGLAQLTTTCTVAERLQHASNKPGYWTVYC